MNTPTQSKILIITTHYPFGTIQENWIEPELDELLERFSEVRILPIKELPSSRLPPKGVQVSPPLASTNRFRFFLKYGVMLRTWAYFLQAIWECAREAGISRARVSVCFKFSCYRVALEANETVKLFLTQQCPTVVYAYWGHLPALIVPKASQSGTQTCVRYHAGDLYIERPEVGGFLPWRSNLRKYSHLNAFISAHGKAYYESRAMGEARGECKVFRLGSRDSGPPGAMMEGQPEAQIIMASASWVHPIKRVELIAAVAGELARHKSVLWHHFGKGTSDDVDRAVHQARNLGAKIVFHGEIPTEILQAFYRSNNITFFINLSRDEGIPVSVMEALNADIPVVATDVGGTAEVVVSGRSGMLVEQDVAADVREIASRILAGLEPEGYLTKSRPRRIWEERCNAKALAAHFADNLLALAHLRIKR